MLQKNALVSVIIVTRDRLQLLERAIKSVLSQSYQAIEIIVVDNFSEEKPRLDTFSESSIAIKLIRTTAYLSAAKSRNVGISHATGEYICFLDDDDYYFPHKIKTLMHAFLVNPAIEMAVSNTQMLGVNQQEIGVCVASNEIVSLMLYRGAHLNAVMIKKSILLNNLFDEDMTTYEDVDLMFRLVSAHLCVHVDEILAVWNRDQRSDQLTNKNYQRAEKNWLILCVKFFEIIKSNQVLARFYFKKMFLLSVINLKLINSIHYFFRFIYFGFLRF